MEMLIESIVYTKKLIILYTIVYWLATNNAEKSTIEGVCRNKYVKNTLTANEESSQRLS